MRPDDQAGMILGILRESYPNAQTALVHGNPFELLVSTILSAQCTDQRVNVVTQELFTRYRTPEDFAHIPRRVLEREIHSTGFFRMKAGNIIGCARAILERYKGEVPAKMAELVSLPGVGRKTANVVLSEAFGISEGIVVDTHVHRVSKRLGLAGSDSPVRIEEELMDRYPRRDWREVGTLLILHGRAVCRARSPQCASCSVSHLCPSAELYL